MVAPFAEPLSRHRVIAYQDAGRLRVLKCLRDWGGGKRVAKGAHFFLMCAAVLWTHSAPPVPLWPPAGVILDALHLRLLSHTLPLTHSPSLPFLLSPLTRRGTPADCHILNSISALLWRGGTQASQSPIVSVRRAGGGFANDNVETSERPRVRRTSLSVSLPDGRRTRNALEGTASHVGTG